ncbi:hypothetical protein [Polyangium aurulentum]|uniref:hypothetical protein n=1 Tax=Polyangium aurulentum TaxID=2567896 RepID=UPI0010ADAE89|nr:hypothetical protein [Polyangium aurulentum]UQA57959.1 hypothetical protein E8A73_042940 [Polyangium aurulentum]
MNQLIAFSRNGRVFRRLARALVVGLAFAAAPALAQTAVPKRASQVSVQDQLDMDITPLPTGYGAVFVPSPGGRLPGASVLVQYEGETVARGYVGERIPVPPGQYRVLVGSGPEALRATSEVTVIKGMTVTAPQNFGVLRVSLVDERKAPIEDKFVVASADGARVYGPISTSTDKAKKPEAIILPPGKYVFALGTNPNARENSIAIQVSGDELVDYRVVVEDGKIVRTEFGRPEAEAEPSPWRVQWVIGGDVSFAQRMNQFTTYNGNVFTMGGFTNFEGAYDSGRHLAQLNVGVDEMLLSLTSPIEHEFPLRKIVDEVSAELLYNYRVVGIVGPYAHAMGLATIFNTTYRSDGPYTATTRDVNGNVLKQGDYFARDELETFDGGFPMFFQEGAGFGTRYDFFGITLGIRAGAAMRQSLYGGGRYVQGRTGSNLDLIALEDSFDYGAEASALAGFTLFKVFSVKSRFDLFVDSDQFAGFLGETYRPIYRWDNIASLRLSRYASVVYTAVLKRDAAAVAPSQFAHTFRLRFQAAIF